MVDLYKRTLVSKGLLGAVGLATLATASLTKTASAATIENPYFIYYLQPEESLENIIAQGFKIIVLDPNKSYTWSGLEINNKEQISIIGNQAVVNSGNTNSPALAINESTNIIIENVIFKGANTGSIYASSANQDDNGIVIYKSNTVTVKGCSFSNFTGAGINMYNYKGNKLYLQNIIQGNRFVDCQYGIAIWYNSEYSLVEGNEIANCRIGIYNSSGNISIIGNVIVKCRASLVSTNSLNSIKFAEGGNHAHGTIVGNSFNHSNDSGFPASKIMVANGAEAIQGLFLEGVIPHNITSNSFWYTDLAFRNILDDVYLTGCVFSNNRITVSGKKVYLAGCNIRSSTFIGSNVINNTPNLG